MSEVTHTSTQRCGVSTSTAYIDHIFTMFSLILTLFISYINPVISDIHLVHSYSSPCSFKHLIYLPCLFIYSPCFSDIYHIFSYIHHVLSYIDHVHSCINPVGVCVRLRTTGLYDPSYTQSVTSQLQHRTYWCISRRDPTGGTQYVGLRVAQGGSGWLRVAQGGSVYTRHIGITKGQRSL